MDATRILDFEEFVGLLRQRLFGADALDRSKLHDFQDLMSDVADVAPEGWYDDAFEELEAQGHLHKASGRAMGGAVFGRLSAAGRLYIRSEDAA